jgi:hypothetical protein
VIATDGIEALAVFLIDHPDAGDVIPGSGGVRKLRWAARLYLIRCYAKNVKTDVTGDEKKQLRQIAVHLKGAQ